MVFSYELPGICSINNRTCFHRSPSSCLPLNLEGTVKSGLSYKDMKRTKYFRATVVKGSSIKYEMKQIHVKKKNKPMIL